jgi:hypothetical protein
MESTIETSLENKAYIEGLKKALDIVNGTARFGIEKTVAGIQEEIKNVETTQKAQ